MSMGRSRPMTHKTKYGSIRFPATVAASAALLLVACGPKPLKLPEQPIDRAATCGVVAAADARATAQMKAALPFEAQGRIFHYALLAASEGDQFAPETANAVARRMSELQDEITSGDWQSLVPACASAYPSTAITAVTLPADRFDAELGCDALGDFMTTALQGSERDYGNEIASYQDLSHTLGQALALGIRSRVGADLQAQQAARRTALARTAKLGPPVAVMQLCIERYGGRP